MRRSFVGLLVLLWVGLGWAQGTDSISRLIDDGKYQEAYAAAVKLGTSEGWTQAAKAASFYAGYQAKESERGSWYDRAEDAAQKAIAADKNNPEAYFELARADGRLAQFRGILQSLSLAASVRDNLNKVLQLNPKHAGARVALALWNLELTQKGVGWLYGADGGRIIPLFEEAIKLEPEEIIHKVEYAGALAKLGRLAEARKQYEAALALTPKTAADRYDLERAKRELAALK